MAYQEINLDVANSGAGSDARAAGGFINNNFKELYSRSFKRDDWVVTRWSYDPNNLQFTTWLNEDVVEGWYDIGTKDRWVKFLIVDASALTLPIDIDDKNKVFVLLDVLKI